MAEKERKYQDFVLNFFETIGSTIEQKKDDKSGLDYYKVDMIPRSFSDMVKRQGPYSLSFSGPVDGCEQVSEYSLIGAAVNRFLDSAGKTTLLKIDFDVDSFDEVKKRLDLSRAEIEMNGKREESRFFTRFSFMTTFSFLNNRKQFLNEIYVHDGDVVTGDLSGYKILEGEEKKIKGDFLKNDFQVAKEHLKGLIEGRRNEYSRDLGQMLDSETKRIEEYYDRQLSEISEEINEKVKKINEIELQARTSEDESVKSELKLKVERLRKGLLKSADEETKERILREKDFSLRDSREKYSLDIKNKVMNTTVIYYPVFIFSVCFRYKESKRFSEVAYNPMTKSLEGFDCEACSSPLFKVCLCSNGHLVCPECLDRCDECSKEFCYSCLKRKCEVCSRSVCANCLAICRSCSKLVCKTHLKKDNVSGEERCVNCLKSCFRCGELAEEKYFKRSEKDGSLVCLKCLGKERRKEALGEGFE